MDIRSKSLPGARDRRGRGVGDLLIYFYFEEHVSGEEKREEVQLGNGSWVNH